MKNYLQPESPITVVSDGTHSSGDFVVIGSLQGVAGIDVVANDDLPLHTEGVFTLPKTTSEAWALGQALYWNTSTKKFTTDSSKLPVDAVAAAAAGSSDTTGAVKIGDAPLRLVAGQITTATAADTVVTGLAKVIACGAGLDDNPGDDPMLANATLGDQAGSPDAGSIIVKTWKNTGGTDPTPAAASTFSKKVNWWAVGYA